MPTKKGQMPKDGTHVIAEGKFKAYEPRRWFISDLELHRADQCLAEARTRQIDVSTFPVWRTDSEIFVFTRGELEKLAPNLVPDDDKGVPF